MPVQMVRRDVQHDRGERLDGGAPVQLEAGQLHGHDLVRIRLGHHVGKRGADIAGRHCAVAGSAQHQGQHPHGRGLAVRARDGQPLLPAAMRQRRPEPPGQLDIANHLDAGGRGAGKQRRVRFPSRRGDHEVGTRRQRGCRGLTE